jgi:elongation of very long chain fatty acids protein 4
MDGILAHIAPLVAQVSTALAPFTTQLDDVEASVLGAVDPTGKVQSLTAGWWLADFSSAAYVVIVYLLFVTFGSALFSQKFMPAIDPYPLKFFYNLSQMMLCSYMTIEAGLVAYRNSYQVWPCNAFLTENPPVLNVLYLFYLSKLWDFWDTFFMIINKKWDQLTFLHVYHHSSIFLFYWLNTRVNYDGDIYLTIVLNGAIHTVMYTYYFICMHTKVPKKWLNQETLNKFPRGASVPIWWKSILTRNQMIQFCVMITQASVLLYKECAMPAKIITQYYMVYIFTMLFLFAQFFIKSYVKPKGGKKEKKN